MKAAIFGMGSIGKRQAGILTRMGVEVVHFSHNHQRPQDFWPWTGGYNWGLFERIAPDMAIICTPTDTHIGIAISCMYHGCQNIFVEKPIGAGIRNLPFMEVAQATAKATVYIAYPLRFHPEIKRMKQTAHTFYLPQITAMTHLPSWHPSRRLEDTYSYRRATGGGALLELSHEIDMAEYLFGDILDIECHAGRMGGVTLDAEDYAILVTTHSSGNICSLLLNINAYRENRFLEYWGNDNGGYKRVDYSAIQECYEKQMDYFLENLGNPTLMNNLLDAAKLFRKIMGVRDEIK